MIGMFRVFTIALAALFSTALPAVALEVRAPHRVAVGDLISVSVVPDRPISSVSARLIDPQGIAVTAARGFRTSDRAGADRWAILLGTASTFPAGRYTIRTTVETRHGAVRESIPLLVSPRSFRPQRIALDARLSVLQGENTARKRAQAAQLWSILTTFSPGALFQRGPLILPVKGAIVSSPYGARRFFAFAHGGGRYSVHQGVDMAIPAGSPIRAAGAGRVEFAGRWLMTGNTVVIEHLPGLFSLYFHFKRMEVHVGEVVKQGQLLGLSGSTGLATGPVLDWKVEVNGVAVDPMSLLSRQLISPDGPRS